VSNVLLIILVVKTFGLTQSSIAWILSHTIIFSNLIKTFDLCLDRKLDSDSDSNSGSYESLESQGSSLGSHESLESHESYESKDSLGLEEWMHSKDDQTLFAKFYRVYAKLRKFHDLVTKNSIDYLMFILLLLPLGYICNLIRDYLTPIIGSFTCLKLITPIFYFFYYYRIFWLSTRVTQRRSRNLFIFFGIKIINSYLAPSYSLTDLCFELFGYAVLESEIYLRFLTKVFSNNSTKESQEKEREKEQEEPEKEREEPDKEREGEGERERGREQEVTQGEQDEQCEQGEQGEERKQKEEKEKEKEKEKERNQSIFSLNRDLSKELDHIFIWLALTMTVSRILALILFVVFYYPPIFYDIMEFCHLPLLEPLKTCYLNGVFDLGHYNHMALFNKAKLTTGAHRLIVGVMSDNDVKKYKGESRPIDNASERVQFVKNFPAVTEVIRDAPWNDVPLQLIKEYDVDCVVHSSEYLLEDPDYAYRTPRNMGIVILIPRGDGVSTTKRIDTILGMRGL
jgi:glycerol-3-phosphate cytidylyltransferase-like family protein